MVSRGEEKIPRTAGFIPAEVMDIPCTVDCAYGGAIIYSARGSGG